MKSADGGFFIAWRIITFLLVFLGFLALASTGELSLPVCAGFVILLGAAFFTAERPDFWHDWMAKAVVWCALAVIGLIALPGNFVSVLYLMLFLVLYKCFSLREALDHLHALIMSFFMFLACSIITSSMTYMIIMFLYIVLMMLDMICLTIAREGARVFAGFGTGVANRTAVGSAASQPFWRRLFLSSMVVGTLILMLTVLLSLAIPHARPTASRPLWLSPRTVSGPRLSGYSDELNFNNFSELKLDTHEVMKVFTVWQDGVARPFPANLRLRGQALNRYDMNHWYLQSRHTPKESSKWDDIHFQEASTFRGPVLQQTFNQNAAGLRRLFGASIPFQFSFAKNRHHTVSLLNYNLYELPDPFKLHLDYHTQALSFIPTAPPGADGLLMTSYTVYSRVAEDAMPLMEALLHARQTGVPDPARLQALNYASAPDPDLKMSAYERSINTALPQTSLKRLLVGISHEVANGASDYEKIIQLGQWFATRFEYSLSPQPSIQTHPLESFLTRTHKGHCEYFASAFAMLLRAQGIPARIAIGFYTGELHDATGRPYYTVRQSDAHAWAEVWLDGYGWLTFDPTPSAWRGRFPGTLEKLSLWVRFSEWTKSAWQRYILDYSDLQQQKLVAQIVNHPFTQSLLLLGHSLVETAKSLLLMRTEGARPTTRELYTRLVLLLVALGLFLVLLWRFCARLRRQAKGGAACSPVTFMNQFMQRLHALGWKRSPSQTPAEWIQDIRRQMPGDIQLEWVLDLYHRCRFAQESPTPDEEARVREVIRQLH